MKKEALARAKLIHGIINKRIEKKNRKRKHKLQHETTKIRKKGIR